MKKILLFSQAAFLLAFLTLLAGSSAKMYQQPSGELQGKVLDATTGKGIPFAPIALLNDTGKIVANAYSDIDGNYSIKPVAPGKYSIKAQYTGYNWSEIKGVAIAADKITFLDIKLNSSAQQLNEVRIYSKAIISPDYTSQGQTYSVTRSNPNDIVAPSAGVFRRDLGGNTISGNRSYNNKYYVDGIPMPQSTSTRKQRNANAKATVTTDYPDAEYAPTVENEFKSTRSEPLSTFSVDVDDASYCNFRRYTNAGQLIPKDGIRIEEFINNFHYNYPEPTDEHPFSVTMEQAVCPWNSAHQVIGIGIKGKAVSYASLPPSNLVFLIDVSGSMMPENRLPLVKKCFKLLVKNLRDADKVAIVSYAGNAGLVLASTPGSDKDKIYTAIDNLEAGGSTAGGEGISLAYKVAKENFIKGGNNRVILATDGDFNVGISSEADLTQLIESKRDDGIFLTTLGVGEDNYKDAKMELLADKGNGNYSYLDNYEQGRKVFQEQITSTLYVIAKDVKLQLEFNPALVKGYRLIGYEDRMLNKEDFNNDKKDAGDIGTGHTVTAFYEIIPGTSEEKVTNVDSLKYQSVKNNPSVPSNEILTLKLRYKKPDENKSKLIVRTLTNHPQNIDSCSENFRFASSVAEFALVLRDSKFKAGATFAHAIEQARKSKGADENGSRAEFLKLAATAAELANNNIAKNK